MSYIVQLISIMKKWVLVVILLVFVFITLSFQCCMKNKKEGITYKKYGEDNDFYFYGDNNEDNYKDYDKDDWNSYPLCLLHRPSDIRYCGY